MFFILEDRILQSEKWGLEVRNAIRIKESGYKNTTFFQSHF